MTSNLRKIKRIKDRKKSGDLLRQRKLKAIREALRKSEYANTGRVHIE